MVFEVFIDVERVEVFRIEAGQQHIDNDGEVELFAAFLRQVGVGELLVLDPFLDVLVVEVELVDAVVRAESLVVVSDDRCERGLLAVRGDLVVVLFLGQVFLDLLDVGTDVGG
jgi:hypothetical protein